MNMRIRLHMRQLALFAGLVAAFAGVACKKKEDKQDNPAPSGQSPQQVQAKVNGSSVSFTSTVAAAYSQDHKITILTTRKDGSDEWELKLILYAPTSRQDTSYNGSGMDAAEMVVLTKNPRSSSPTIYTMSFNSSASFQFSLSGNTVQGSFSASNLQAAGMGGNPMSISDGSFKANFVR